MRGRGAELPATRAIAGMGFAVPREEPLVHSWLGPAGGWDFIGAAACARSICAAFERLHTGRGALLAGQRPAHKIYAAIERLPQVLLCTTYVLLEFALCVVHVDVWCMKTPCSTTDHKSSALHNTFTAIGRAGQSRP